MMLWEKDASMLRGITLLELLVTIVILAVLATIAVPNLTQLIHNNRVVAQNNELVALIALAKSQAVRQNSDYVVEFVISNDGWSAFLNRDLAIGENDAEEGLDPTCSVSSIRCAEHQRVLLAVGEDGGPLVFDQRGYLPGLQARSLILQHQPCRGDRQRREITVTGTGQIRSEAGACE